MINKIKNKIKKILGSIGLIILLYFFSTFLSLIFNINLETITDKEYAMYLTIVDIILVFIYIYIFKDTLKKDIKDFINNFSNFFKISLKHWSIGLGIMFISNIIISFILNKNMTTNEELVRNYISAAPILMLIAVGICAPITEELTFRKGIRNAINNKWLYVLISGIIFGGLHIITSFNNITDLVYLIPYCAPGIAFALLYYKTDNIFCSITMHSIHNILAMILYLIGASII